MFNPWIENSWVSNNSNHWIYESKWFFFSSFTPAKVVVYQSIHFLTHRSVFLRLSIKFELWIACVHPKHFATFVFVFSVWFFKMALHPLLDLLSTEFKIIEISLFCGEKHRKQEYPDSWLLLTRWRYLLIIEEPVFLTCDGWTLFGIFHASPAEVWLSYFNYDLGQSIQSLCFHLRIRISGILSWV